MKYFRFIILLFLSLTIITTSTVVLVSANKLQTKDTDVKNTFKASAMASLSVGCVLLLYSFYQLYKAKNHLINPGDDTESSVAKVVHFIVGGSILGIGMSILYPASALSESDVAKRDIINSASVLLVLGAGIFGKVFVDAYTSNVAGMTEEEQTKKVKKEAEEHTKKVKEAAEQKIETAQKAAKQQIETAQKAQAELSLT
jgi:hypothetical protein